MYFLFFLFLFKLTENDVLVVRKQVIHFPLFSLTKILLSYVHLTDLGIEKSIFIKPKTFHLTVLMLKLWNKDRVHAATEVLQVSVTESNNNRLIEGYLT